MVKRADLVIAVTLCVCALLTQPTEAKMITVRADGTGDYPTIQAAIDAAINGDEIVLERGTYTGRGNRDLDYNGKAITIRSVKPQDDACMRETIIDAEGEGVIVRFVNNEGPQSIFEGFTLGGGDTSEGVRGEPGFFEFSKDARPATSRLRNKEAAGRPKAGASTAARFYSAGLELEGYTYPFPGWIPPFAGRAWQGYNPFHQPAATTDYYGSGDVDNDGDLTPADASLAQDMADGTVPSVARVDVDGDGDIDRSDVSLINSALSGAVLPGRWNSLTTRQQRHDWTGKFMAIDRTDEHTYYSDYFVCHDFAYQTFIHCAFLRADFPTEYTEYDGGRTAFNVPLYYVTVGMPTWHAINGILVGDNPLDFDDWRFIEPQSDRTVIPGQWNMRYDSDVSISAPTLYGNAEILIKFHVDAAGWGLVQNSPDLVTARPLPPEEAPDNRPDLWNPRIVPVGSGMILFERTRDDMSRTTDVHIADLPFEDPPAGAALVEDAQFSRLLDVTQAPDRTIHLLWEGKDSNYKQNLFHGRLDPTGRALYDVTQVSTGIRMPAMGRVVVTPTNNIHVFWYEYHPLGPGEFDNGIYWTRRTPGQWQTPQNLTPDIEYVDGRQNWINRQFDRYLFDAAVLDNGRIVIVRGSERWAPYTLNQLTYDGLWTPSTISTESWFYGVRGVDLCKDSDGLLHLAYWLADEQGFYEGEEGRGNMLHRTGNGLSWSSAVTVDSSDNACCPQMAAGADGRIYLVWERKVAGQVVPVWNKYESGIWGTAEQLSVAPGADAWYPTLDAFDDARVVVAWSSRSDQRVTIATDSVGSVIGDFDGNRDLDLRDFAVLAEAWRSINGQPHWNPACDISRPKDNVIDERDLKIYAHNWLIGLQ